MPKINLLPPDTVSQDPALKVARVVGMVAFIGSLIFMCFCAISVALFVVNSLKLTTLVKNRNQLLTVIEKNYQTEQSLFLVRDRLEKIKTIQAQKSSGQLLKDVPQILASVPSSVILNSATLVPSESEMVFGTGDSVGIGQLMTTMTSEGSAWSTLNLNSFTYSDKKGYSLGFGIIK